MPLRIQRGGAGDEGLGLSSTNTFWRDAGDDEIFVILRILNVFLRIGGDIIKLISGFLLTP